MNFLGPKPNKNENKEHATLRHTTRKKRRAWSRCRWYRHSYRQDIRVRWKAALHATFHRPLGRDLTQLCVRFGTATLGLTNCPNCRFFSTGLFPQGPARPYVHGAVTLQPSHSWISPILLFVLSISDFTAYQHVSCGVHSQLLTAAVVQRLRVNGHSNPPSCRCQRPFPTAPCHLNASHGLTGTPWSACGQLQSALQL